MGEHMLREGKAALRLRLREIPCIGGAKEAKQRESIFWEPGKGCYQEPRSSSRKCVALEGLWLGKRDNLAVTSVNEWPETS